MKILFVDMDNVLVDFKSGINRLDKDEKKKFLNNYDEAPGIFSKMLPMPQAISSYEILSKKYDTYILSTAPRNNPTAWSDKLLWVKKYLGKYLDFHGGGIDLIFPHHENEIAQSVCANDYQKLSNYWLHNGYVTVDKQKMSKSLGNFITINELKNNYNGQVIRLTMLSTHYTQPFDWNKNILENSRKSLEKWYEFYSDEPESINDVNLKYLLDDLNTPLMISNINDLYKKAKSGDTLSAKQLSSSCKILGLFNQNAEEWKNSKKIGKMPPEEIEQLILQRNEARAKKDFETSDKIRDLLVSKGVLIKDKDGNTSWEYK